AHPDLHRPSAADRRGGEEPGEALVAQQLPEPAWDPDHEVVVPAAGLQEEDTVRGVGREAVGEDASGRARTDDHVVERLAHVVAPAPGCGAPPKTVPCAVSSSMRSGA